MSRIGDHRFRWRVANAGGFVPLLFLLLVPSASAQCLRWGNADFIAKQTATESLTLIKPPDPLFDGMLAQFYPGLSDAPGYQTSLQPFLVMVRNDTALTAVAYAIAWTEHYSDGSVKPLSAVFVNRPFTSGMKFLPPSRMRLISPGFNLTLDDYQQQQRSLAQYPAEAYPWSKELTSVDVEVDGVVYSDGTFIGQDKTGVLQCFMMARFAARDEALATLKYIQSSSTTPFMIPGHLEETLDKELQWGLKAYKDTLLALYVRARGNTASDLSRILQHRGLAGLETLLQSYVNHNGRGTSPSMFAGMYQNLSDTDPRVFGSLVSPNAAPPAPPLIANAEQPFSLTLATPTEPAKAGDPVVLMATVTNTSTQLEQFPFSGGTNDVGMIYQMHVLDEQGQPVPRRLLPKGQVWAGSVFGAGLESGQSMEDRLNLSYIYDLSRPGKYQIWIAEPYGGAPPTGLVVSNTITLTVVK